ncbi:hypothetical protein FQ192_13840 [Pseudomonas sp. ANT_J12]|nr:hypothetical protein FQ192_13840 [Pseudomonas sp. ANT_J12]
MSDYWLPVPTLPRGNAARDALRHSGRGASMAAFPCRAWERSCFSGTRHLFHAQPSPDCCAH